ncbi:MAG TPA: prepilin-type N-terminal cleavage/methylation domain-containing protein [Patescibacteria group bacterium]|nr:prepilin-type N-terminal cleavage/methylation domain-containing protein [Patescibacteria group bacterium]
MKFSNTHVRKNQSERGFTIIELLVVVVVLIILGTLVALTYSGVQAKNRNSQRQNAINNTQAQLEAYYAGTNKYPTLANLSDAAWRASNLKHLAANSLQDPRWNKTVKKCTIDGKVSASSEPAANCYSYQVTASDGSACDNVKIICAHYTLTATLEGGEKYVKGSLN